MQQSLLKLVKQRANFDMSRTYEDSDINALNVIHVAGTKGKGTTCAFVESLLRIHGKRTGFPHKTGLYTSPHLIFPEERIRINFEPLSKEAFAKYFFEVYDGLKSCISEDNQDSGPRYLQLFALLSFHTFIRERVDVAITETHHGGEYDATNFVEQPVVTAVTALGMDHVISLGPSLENIAWHKAGVFKRGAPAFSSLQQPAPAEVLQLRANEKGSQLAFIDVDPNIPTDNSTLKPDVQRKNCSLALAVAKAFLERRAPLERRDLIASDIVQAAKQFSWPGRFQIVNNRTRQWFLDGAHNEMSIKVAAKWFFEAVQEQPLDATENKPITEAGKTHSVRRLLLFSHHSNQRDGAAILKCLAKALKDFDMSFEDVIFTTYQLEAPSITFDRETITSETELVSKTLEQHAEIWKSIHAQGNIFIRPTIRQAVELMNVISEQYAATQILVTGSQYMVGGVLRLLQEIQGNDNVTT
ncbi:MAG: hypothetical protein M1820_009257 [Bogoriella megaspora]|nr:MAG: hypothetical protein M1820_009257 [Bogoriella megaspora]